MRRYHPHLRSAGRTDRRVPFRFRVAAAFGSLILVVAGCGSDSDEESDAGLDPETQAACQEYNAITNQWGRAYGTEMGAVGEARADGDEQREEEAVETVRELFLDTAHALHEQADAVSDEELAAGFHQSADGAEEIAEQIETYEDVAAAPELMSGGDFGAGGETVQRLCAGRADVPISPVPTN